MLLPEQSFGIGALMHLIQQWVDTSFVTASKRDFAKLNSTWFVLASVLCDEPSPRDSFSKIVGEIAEINKEGREGAPPLRSIEQRLRQLVHAGLAEGFLVVAVRDTLEDLITLHHPSSLQEWIQLADQIVPRNMRLAHRGNALPPM